MNIQNLIIGFFIGLPIGFLVYNFRIKIKIKNIVLEAIKTLQNDI